LCRCRGAKVVQSVEKVIVQSAEVQRYCNGFAGGAEVCRCDSEVVQSSCRYGVAEMQK
jgi:hypothetical protein